MGKDKDFLGEYTPMDTRADHGKPWFTLVTLEQTFTLYTCTVITVHLYRDRLFTCTDILKTRAHQGRPWQALAYSGPGLYPGQPWFTLVAGDQSNQIQEIEGVIYLTRADPGQPWLTLVTLEQSSDCTPVL